MSLHHGLTDLRNDHFTDRFPTSYQASLRFCLWAKLTSKLTRYASSLTMYLVWLITGTRDDILR